MKVNKKSYIILFGILIIYTVIMIILFGTDYIKKKTSNTFLFVSPDTRWHYFKGNWTSNVKANSYNNINFDVYIDSKKLAGEYNLVYNDEMYIFNKNKDSIDYEGKLLGYHGIDKIDVKSFEEQDLDVNDSKIIDEVLEKNKVSYYGQYAGKKIVTNIDKDNDLESIYYVFNIYDDTITNNAFVFTFILDNGKVEYLYQNVGNKSDIITKMCVPSIHSIVDLDSDKNYEIIMSCEFASMKGTCNYLYKKGKKGYEILAGC